MQLDGAVGGAAVHGAVERPALVDGGDVHVRGHGRAQLLPQLAVLARVRAPQACNQAQRHACVAHLQQSNRAGRTESSFSQEKVVFKHTSLQSLQRLTHYISSIIKGPILKGSLTKQHFLDQKFCLYADDLKFSDLIFLVWFTV